MVLEETLVAKAFDFGLLFADLGGIVVVDRKVPSSGKRNDAV